MAGRRGAGKAEAAARATWNTARIMADPGQTPWQRQQWAEREKEALEAADPGCYQYEEAGPPPQRI